MSNDIYVSIHEVMRKRFPLAMKKVGSIGTKSGGQTASVTGWSAAVSGALLIQLHDVAADLLMQMPPELPARFVPLLRSRFSLVILTTLIWKCIGIFHMSTLGCARIDCAPRMGAYFLHLFG